MKVVTYGPSPYLNTSKGRAHRSIIKKLVEDGHIVCTIAFDYDKTYFMDEGGTYYYEEEGDFKHPVTPINKGTPKSEKAIYDYIEKESPEVVLTVGDYFETDEISLIKDAKPRLFKWVGVLICRSTPIENKYKSVLDNMDCIISTNSEAYYCINQVTKTPSYMVELGYDPWVFADSVAYEEYEGKFVIGTSLKNAHSNNFPAFLSIVNLLKLRGVDCFGLVHFNRDDEGDYDFEDLIKRSGLENSIGWIEDHKNKFSGPTYVSVHEGPGNDFMRSFYTACDAFVDPSVYAATGVSLLEAIQCGCIPVCGKFGAFKDIGWEKTFVSTNNFIADRSQNMRVISDIDAVRVIEEIYNHYVFADGVKSLDPEYRRQFWHYSRGLKDKTRERFTETVVWSCEEAAKRKRTKLSVESLS